MSIYKDYKEKVLQNPKVKAEYDALQPEYDIIQAMIDARLSQNITQKELAARTGITQADISRIENGTRKELVSSNYLTLNKYDMTGYNKVINDKPFQLVSIIEGQGTVEGKEVRKGDHFVVCSDQKEVDFDGTMTVMICTL